MTENIQAQWILKSRVRRFFMVAAVAASLLILSLAIVLAATLTGGVERTQSFVSVVWLKPFWFALGVLGAPLALSLWIGMLWHCVTAYRNSRWLRVCWFVFLILGNWLVSPLYYLCVFRKETGGQTA